MVPAHTSEASSHIIQEVKSKLLTALRRIKNLSATDRNLSEPPMSTYNPFMSKLKLNDELCMDVNTYHASHLTIAAVIVISSEHHESGWLYSDFIYNLQEGKWR